MDPLSHGLFGMGLAQSFSKSKSSEFRLASFAGFIAALIADLDILIRSSDYPLLALKFHRHFSHSLFFTPIGGLFATILLWPIYLRSPMGFLRLWFFCFLGYLTHGLLDSCTSYGTMLFWPLSDARIAWDNISIVDPILTGLFLLFCFWAHYKKSVLWGRIGFFFAFSYLLFGLHQRDEADNFFRQQIAKNHNLKEIKRIEVKPSFGNIILWRGIYEFDGFFYTDALRLFPGEKSILYPGSKIKKVEIDTEFPFLNKKSVLYQDLKLFEYFSDHMLAFGQNEPDFLGDIRYSLLPNEIAPLWGVKIDLNNSHLHVPFKNVGGFNLLEREGEEKMDHFLGMLRGKK